MASQSLNLVSMVAWSWQAASVTSDGHVRDTEVAGSTVKVEEQVTSASHSFATVQVTVVLPPQ